MLILPSICILKGCLIGKLLVRAIVCELLRVNPSALEFSKTDLGRPYLVSKEPTYPSNFVTMRMHVDSAGLLMSTAVKSTARWRPLRFQHLARFGPSSLQFSRVA